MSYLAFAQLMRQVLRVLELSSRLGHEHIFCVILIPFLEPFLYIALEQAFCLKPLHVTDLVMILVQAVLGFLLSGIGLRYSSLGQEIKHVQISSVTYKTT